MEEFEFQDEIILGIKNIPNKRSGPNIIDLAYLNRLENNNTMYYNVGTIVRWDDRKAVSNLKKHGVSFEEAASVLFTESTIEIEDSRHDEQRFIIIGFSNRTRLLTVVYAYKYEEEIRIISARKATKNEAAIYEERV